MRINENLTGQFSEGRIDKANRTISGVLIMNRSSSNKYYPGSKGTHWSENFLREIAKAVSGKKIYNNHISDDEMKKNRGVRSTNDLLGFYENGRIEEGLPRADIRYLKHQSEFIESLMEAPETVGLSIVANGEMSYNKSTGIALGESLNTLFSVDLVTDPGSTSNMFESSHGEEKKNSFDEDIIQASQEIERNSKETKYI